MCTLVNKIVMDMHLVGINHTGKFFVDDGGEMAEHSFCEVATKTDEANTKEVRMMVHKISAVDAAHKVVTHLVHNGAAAVGDNAIVAAQEVLEEPAANAVSASGVAAENELLESDIFVHIDLMSPIARWMMPRPLFRWLVRQQFHHVLC